MPDAILGLLLVNTLNFIEEFRALMKSSYQNFCSFPDFFGIEISSSLI